MKRLLAAVLAVALSVGICLPAYADTTGTITVDNAVEGQVYSAYRILDLESYNKDAGAYAYKANGDWADWLKTQTEYITFDAQGYATWVEGADVAQFAVDAQAYAKAEGIQPVASETAGEGAVAFTGLALGYYLVDTTLGTICSLDTTNPTVSIEEKNTEPSITKRVQEDSSGVWGATSDVDINQVVNYQVVVTVNKGAENYTVHDTMSAGLTFNANSVVVSVNEKAIAADSYTLSAPAAGCEDGCTFEIEFDNAFIKGLGEGAEIVINYSATLNENAVIGLSGNTNKVLLQYGDDAKYTFTPAIEVVTYTWDANVFKFTGTDPKTPLADAVFELYGDEACSGEHLYKFHTLVANEYQVCADAACAKVHVTQITTDRTGKFHISGLDADTYYLDEVQAPAGYNALAAPVTVSVSGATQGESGLKYSTVTAEVENKTGTEMPSTGGMGTMLLYGAGAVLVIGSAILLVARRRAASEE